MDDPEDDYSFDEFKKSWFSRQVGVSAEHGIGIDQLTDLFQKISSYTQTFYW